MLLSVIIPIYNGEKHVERAIRSVLAQMDGRVELILVNDGSTDNSGTICDQYARGYSNVRVVHKANGGVSSSRNAGIDAARGLYLSFLDSDDFWEQGCCNEICKALQQTSPDILDFGWRYVTNGTPLSPAFHKIPKKELLNEQIIKETVLPPLLNLCEDSDHFIFDFVWAKVFKLEMLHSHRIRFDESRKIWEDRPFLVHYLKYSKTFYSMDQCFYNYVDTPNSLGRRYNMDFFRIIVENFQQYNALFGTEYDFDTQYVNDYWCHAVENMIVHSLGETKNLKQIKQNILEALSHEQVIHWYTKRSPQNAVEREISHLVISGEYEQVLLKYEKIWKKKQKKQNRALLIYRTKQSVKRLLGR